MVISDNGASAEGGPTGTTNEAQFFNNAPESFEDSLAADRRDRWPDDVQPLPVGLDVGRQHAVPSLEAGDLPRRGQRPVHRHLAGGHQRPWRGPHPVRAHHRHGADRAGPARRSSRRQTIRGVTQSPLHGVSFAHTLDDADAPSGRRTQYFEMFGHRAHLPRRMARGLSVAGPVVRRGRSGVRRAHLGRDAHRARRRRAGSSTTSTRTSRRTTTSPPTTATGSSH